MSERKPRIAVLGQTGIPDATCAGWMDEKLPNFADFDVVFVNEVALGDLIRALPQEPEIELVRALSKRQTEVRDSLVKLIASRYARVYVVLDRTAARIGRFDTDFEKRRPYFLDNSTWCPVPIQRETQDGVTVEILNDDFKDYLDKSIDAWSYTLDIKSEKMAFHVDQLADLFDSTEGKRKLYPIAFNRQKQAIAAAFSYIEMRKNLGSNGRGGWNYGDEFETGTMVFLPPPTKISGDEALLLLFDTVKERIGFPLNKDWEDYEYDKFVRPKRPFPRIDQPNPSVIRPPFIVAERREIPLLTSQKDAIFTALQNAGLDLTQFEWTWTQSNFDYRMHEVQRLLYRPSGYHFTFDKQLSSYPNVWIAQYSPGENQREEAREGTVEDVADMAAVDWPRFLKRELEAPDFWGQLASNPLVLARASTSYDNSPFQGEEREDLLRRLNTIEARLIDLHGNTDAKVEAIAKTIEEMRGASTRVGRKDWVMLVVGQLIGLVTTLGLDGEKARAVFDLVGAGLSGFAGLLPG